MQCAAGLAQLVEGLTAKQEVADLFSPSGETNIQCLKGTAFALQMDRPWCGLDDHIKWWFCLRK